MSDIKYSEFDNRIKKYKKEKIKFANDNGYKYFSELVHNKKKEGLGSRMIADFVNFNEKKFHVTTGSIDHVLRITGVYEYTKVQRKKNIISTKDDKLKLDETYTGNMCGCCKTRHVSPGNRLLCNTCHKTADTTSKHGIVNFTG